VRERPGTTVAEAAQAMGIGPSYLYRIAATLERDAPFGGRDVAPGTRGRGA
jgi:hypothetical protein